MMINKISYNNAMTMQAPTGAHKSLESQIMMKQQNLRKLSNDARMNAEEKEKARRQLQREIEELERKMEKLQTGSAEAKKEEKVEALDIGKAEKEAAKEMEDDDKEDTATPIKEEKEMAVQESMPLDAMQQLFQQNVTVKDEMLQQNAAEEKKSSMRIMKSEIKQDEIQGTDTTSKKEKLKALREKEDFWVEMGKGNKDDAKPVTVNPDVKIVITE